MQKKQIVQALLHGNSEETRLEVLLSTSYLLNALAKSPNSATRQETFNLWLTDPINKENGSVYDWDRLRIAIKRLKKRKAKGGQKEDVEEVKEENDEEEEGEWKAQSEANKTDFQPIIELQILQANAFKSA